MSTILTMFTGTDCGLCDQAIDMVRQISPQAYNEMTCVNVREDHALYHLYGARIPVLKRNDSQEELSWPFNESMLITFLS